MDTGPRLYIAIASIGIGIIVLMLKFAAYWLTGSIALYSDALETIVNVAASSATLAAVWFAAKPADNNHPYGHDKAEYFSAVFIGVMIVLAAISIFHEAITSLLDNRAISYSPIGIAMNVAAAILNGGWALFLMRFGTRERSPALAADGKHLMSDVLTSVGVLAGVGLVYLTGWSILDPLLAALVGIMILGSGWTIMKTSVSGLMDEAASAEVLQQIRVLIAEHGEGALEAHDLRTRTAGRSTFIDFHLVVPGSMTVETAHEICDRIEEAITGRLKGAHITIHVEPEHKAKHSGIVVV